MIIRVHTKVRSEINVEVIIYTLLSIAFPFIFPEKNI